MKYPLVLILTLLCLGEVVGQNTLNRDQIDSLSSLTYNSDSPTFYNIEDSIVYKLNNTFIEYLAKESHDYIKKLSAHDTIKGNHYSTIIEHLRYRELDELGVEIFENSLEEKVLAEEFRPNTLLAIANFLQIDSTSQKKSLILEAIELLELNNQQTNYNYADAQNMLGVLYTDLDEYDDAVAAFQKAENIAQEYKYLELLPTIQFNHARLHYYIHNYEKAKTLFRQIISSNSDPYNSYIAKQAIGVILLRQDSLKKSLKYLKEVDELNIVNEMSRITNLISLQKIAYELKDYKNANKYYLECKAELDKTSTHDNILSVHRTQFLSLLDQNNNKSALAILKTLKYEYNFQDEDLLNLQIHYDLHTGKGVDARKRFARYVDITDSTHVAIVENDAKELTTQYETEKKELQNQKLQQQNELQQAELKTKNAYLLGGGLGLGSLGLLAFLGFRQSRTRQRHNQELQDKNAKIALLNREILHRSKNQLNLATSLIENQKYYAQDAGARSLIEESEYKLRALATVNSKLSDDMEGISLAQVTREIIKANGFSLLHNDQLKVNIDADNITLHPDKLSSIALIINELSVNSIKYAFDQVQHPSIILTASSLDKEILIEYQDNGPGKSIDSSIGTGSGLISGLVNQLNGNYTEKSDSGYTFAMKIPMN